MECSAEDANKRARCQHMAEQLDFLVKKEKLKKSWYKTMLCRDTSYPTIKLQGAHGRVARSSEKVPWDVPAMKMTAAELPL